VNEEQALAFGEEKFRLLATWDARWRNLPPDAVCPCGADDPFVLFPRGKGVLCVACNEETWRRPRVQGQELGGKKTPLSKVFIDANLHRILTDLQELWRAAGFEPGSPFAVGFDIGAYVVICGERVQ
jgi:hypothetical protein